MTNKYAAQKLNDRRIDRGVVRAKKRKPRRDQFKLGFIAAAALLYNGLGPKF